MWARNRNKCYAMVISKCYVEWNGTADENEIEYGTLKLKMLWMEEK